MAEKKRKKKYIPKPLNHKICYRCGEEFLGRPRQKFCSKECRENKKSHAYDYWDVDTQNKKVVTEKIYFRIEDGMFIINIKEVLRTLKQRKKRLYGPLSITNSLLIDEKIRKGDFVII